MAPHSPFFQAQIASRFHHSHSNSVTLSMLEFYDAEPARDPPSTSSAPTAPAAGSSTVQSPTLHRRTSSAAVEGTPRKPNCKHHRRNSAISKRSTSLPMPETLASSNLVETPLDVPPAPPTAPLLRPPRPPSLILSQPPEGPKKPRRSGPRYHVTNPSATGGARRRTPVPSFVAPPSPPPPYSLYPTRSVRRLSVPTADSVPALPSSSFQLDVYTSSPVARSSTFTLDQSGEISPLPMSRQVRPLPAPPTLPMSPELEELELEDPDRRPSLPMSESGVSTASATTASTLTETESVHPFDSDLDEEDTDISTPARDDECDLQTLHSFLDFSSSSSSSASSDTTTGELRLPRKFQSIPVVGTFDPSSPEYSRGTFGAGLKKQYKRIVASGRTLVSVGRNRSASTESAGSAFSSGSRNVDWADALEGTLFG